MIHGNIVALAPIYTPVLAGAASTCIKAISLKSTSFELFQMVFETVKPPQYKIALSPVDIFRSDSVRFRAGHVGDWTMK